MPNQTTISKHRNAALVLFCESILHGRCGALQITPKIDILPPEPFSALYGKQTIPPDPLHFRNDQRSNLVQSWMEGQFQDTS